MVQVTPTDTLSITPTASYIFDDYLSKPPVDPAVTGRQDFLGVQEAVGWTAGVDLSWSPVERLSITAGYTHDSFYRKMESRSRPVPGVLALDFHDYDWISNISDTVDTLYGGVKYAIIPRVLDWGFSGSWSYALGRFDPRNPTAPVSGTAALNFNAQAKPFPAFEDELIRLETAVAYHFFEKLDSQLRLRLRVVPEARLAHRQAQPVRADGRLLDVAGQRPSQLHRAYAWRGHQIQLQVGARRAWQRIGASRRPDL